MSIKNQTKKGKINRMACADIIYDKVHFKHDLRWSVPPRPEEGGLCLACVFEIIEEDEIPSVRKSFALSAVSRMLKSSAELKEMLRLDHKVTLHFVMLLMGLLQTVENPTVEKASEVLLQLLIELQNELPFRFVLDEIQKQLSDKFTAKCLLPTLKFLGNLLKTIHNVASCLINEAVPLLDSLCSTMLYPDEELKSSVVHVWIQLLGASEDSWVHSLPVATRNRLCTLLLQTFASAGSEQLIKNCTGLLWQLVRFEEPVSLLMSSTAMCCANQNILTNNSQNLSQNQEQQPAGQSPLPLLLKKLLRSGDDTLCVTGAKCIAAILVHSPRQYSSFFIKADLPGFLFDLLASSSNEMLLWSLYSCLLLLTEDSLFFTQGHSVYGIESLEHSLKQALHVTSLEVPKQGFLLLNEILERQPAEVHLFRSYSEYAAVSEAVIAGVSSPCLLVASQAVKAATTLLRLNHQSTPIQYREIERLMEVITSRFCELILPSAHRRDTERMRRTDPSSQSFRSKGFLIMALNCFHASCRLAEECASEPILMGNPFTAPYKHKHAEHSQETLCHCLLRCCDSVWIPTVLRMVEFEPNVQILQSFYSILSSQFQLLPNLMPQFATKLASSGFFRLAIEHKALLCAGNRNPVLNASSCGFLQKLSMCLLFQSDPPPAGSYDMEAVGNLLQCSLPSLCCGLSEWPSVLCDYQELRAAQYCMLITLYLAHKQGDRLLPDQTVFSSVALLLQSVQEQDCSPPPRSVLRAALYLLAVCQDRSPSLDVAAAPLNSISKALSSCQSFSALYTHHLALLHFIWRYSVLAERFGLPVFELWLAMKAQKREKMTDTNPDNEKGDSCAEDQERSELIFFLEKYPHAIQSLLDMAVCKDAFIAEQALNVLDQSLCRQREVVRNLSTDLTPGLLRALQQISVENMANGYGQGQAGMVNPFPVVLKLLCLTQSSSPPSASAHSHLEGMHFKLLYHVSSIVGMLKPTNTESLLPAFNYLQCFLSLCPAPSTDRAVSMLISNSGLMDHLQAVISSSVAGHPPPSARSPLALLCCGNLLLSSLITLQRVHPTKVPKSISWSLETAVHKLLLQKRNTDNLLLVSYLRLLQALLAVDLESPLVLLTTGPGLVGPGPLGGEDGALYPLGYRGAQCVVTALTGLLLQKHELLLKASVNCFGSLLGFLKRKHPSTASCVVSQPWIQFLLHCLLSSGQDYLLLPLFLRLLTLLLQHGSTAVLWEPCLRQVIDAAEHKGLKELSTETAQFLRLLLPQVLRSGTPPTAEQRVRRLMEELGPQTAVEGISCSSSSSILYPSHKEKSCRSYNCAELCLIAHHKSMQKGLKGQSRQHQMSLNSEPYEGG